MYPYPEPKLTLTDKQNVQTQFASWPNVIMPCTAAWLIHSEKSQWSDWSAAFVKNGKT